MMFRYQRILVPLDGSKLAEKSIEPVLAIAKAMDSEITFLQVVSGLTLDLDPRLNRRVIDARLKSAQLYLSSLRNWCEKETDTVIEMSVMEGSAAKVIIDCSKLNDIDLVVLTSHGQTGLERWVYGNITAKILRRAPCDTLLIRSLVEGPDLFTTKRILVPLDGSKRAEQALTPAAALARAMGMEIRLLRVSPVIPSELEPMSSRYIFDGLEEKARDESLAYLRGVQSSLESQGLPINIETITGPEAATIVDYAEKYQVDLTVMSSHGLTGIGTWLMGSVSEKLLRKASCATMVVRPQGQPLNGTRINQ